MKTMRRLGAGLIAAMLLAACGSTGQDDANGIEEQVDPQASMGESEPLPFNHHGKYAGTADPVFDEGEPGQVTVVMSEYSGETGRLHLAVRNRTDQTVTNVHWRTDVIVGGDVVAEGRGLGLIPWVLEPGDIGFGYTSFDRDIDVPVGEEVEYEHTVDWTLAEPGDSPVRVLINATEVEVGDDELIVSVENDTDLRTQQSIGVEIYCYSGEEYLYHFDRYIGFNQSYGRANTFWPGDRETVPVGLYGLSCPTYLAVAFMLVEI